MVGLEEYLEANPNKTEMDWAESFLASSTIDVITLLIHGVVEAISETGTTIKGIQAICRHCADTQPDLMENWEMALRIKAGEVEEA